MNKQVFDWQPSARAWFAVRTRPRREELAQLHLERQGFHTYLPKIRKSAPAKRAAEIGLAPFFPSYIFVNLDVERDAWRPINSTIGVSQIVRFGAAPTPLPRGLIEQLQYASDEWGVPGFQDDLQKGDAVTLVGGAFDSLKGIFEGASDQERVQILLTMMSRQVRVTVNRHEVMKVSD